MFSRHISLFGKILSRRESDSSRKTHKPRHLKLEQLEVRQVMAVVVGVSPDPTVVKESSIADVSNDNFNVGILLSEAILSPNGLSVPDSVEVSNESDDNHAPILPVESSAENSTADESGDGVLYPDVLLSTGDTSTAGTIASIDELWESSDRGIAASQDAMGLVSAASAELLSGASAVTHDHAHPDPSMHPEHLQVLKDVVPMEQATHVAVQSGNWSDASIWNNHSIPRAGAKVLIPEAMTVTYDLDNKTDSLSWIRADGTLRFAQNAYLKVETLVGGMEGRIEIGTQASPINGKVVVEFADLGPIQDWSQFGRGLIVMGDLSIYGKETTSYVHVAQNPRMGDTKIVLSEVPKNWQVGGQIVVPGVRPPLPIPQGKQKPVGPEGRDPVFEAQNEIRTITAINGNTITLNAPLSYDLHYQLLDGLTISIGYLDRSIEFTSENTETSRRGHVMVMPAEAHEYQIAYAQFEALGRTSQELFVTDPQKDANGNVIPETVANVRGRYSLHFHKMGFESHATVTGISVTNGLKWGVVNHSSNVDVFDSIAYNVAGAGFATELGNEMGSFQNSLSIQSVGFGDLNDSPARPGRQARKGRPDNTAAERLIAPIGGDFGFNGSGFWLQGSRVRLVGNEVYGAAASGLNVQTISVGTDHLGRPTAIYLSDLTPAEQQKYGLNGEGRKITKVDVPNFPLMIEDCVVVGSNSGVNVWSNVVPELYGGSLIKNSAFQNCVLPIEIGSSAFFTLDGVKAVNHPSAMGKWGPGSATDFYGGGNITLKDVQFRGFSNGIRTTQGGFVKILGSKTFLDNSTNIKVIANKFDLIIELDEKNFGSPNGRNIVFDVQKNFDLSKPFRPKALWIRPGKPTLELFPFGAIVPEPIVDTPGLVNVVARELSVAMVA
jgi:hypothetical protein